MDRKDLARILARSYEPDRHLDVAKAGARDVIGPHADGVDLPIIVENQSVLTDVEHTLDCLQVEEARLTDDPTLKRRVTWLRKIFYDGPGWNQHLIAAPDAVGVPSPYRRVTVSAEDVSLPFSASEALVLTRDQTEPRDALGQVPAAFLAQEARRVDGTVTDVGHVLCGLDAHFHPDVVGYPPVLWARRNVDAVTWVGDLGSWLAEVQFRAVRGESIDARVIDEEREKWAPAWDMLGNLEPFALAPLLSGLPANASAAKTLRRWYLDPDGRFAEARRELFPRAAAGLGLWGFDGETFTNEERWLRGAADDVNDAAAMYFLTLVKGTPGPLAVAFALGLASNAGAQTLVRRLLDGLKAGCRRGRR